MSATKEESFAEDEKQKEEGKNERDKEGEDKKKKKEPPAKDGIKTPRIEVRYEKPKLDSEKTPEELENEEAEEKIKLETEKKRPELPRETMEEKKTQEEIEKRIKKEAMEQRIKRPDFKYPHFKDITEVKEEKYAIEFTNLMNKVLHFYKPDEILLSFNGGKDCTVILHMLHTYFQKNSSTLNVKKIPTLYITDPDAFDEINEFVNECVDNYNIDLIKKKGPIKAALAEVCKENPNFKAVFMGCRRNDPYCANLKVMQMCDPTWPTLMRINPIIDWTCRQVWEYIYLYKVPYCVLYERGYTSLGNKKNTKQNPYLRIIDKATGDVTGYRHANELLDIDEFERAGRL